jgi:hypothetical protein
MIMMLRDAFIAALLLATSQTVRAAQSYDNCNNFIDTLPATITTQGVWCLRHDLATNITSGNAITIAANNVTIDCNDFKLGGLAAGPLSGALGIHADGRQNVAIRRCNIRGFRTGIDLSGSGHLVEDNRLDNNLYTGIKISGDNSLVQRNRVFDTGGGSNVAFGIDSYGADVIDNIVEGVFTEETSYTQEEDGIIARSDGTQISGNVVGGMRVGFMVGICHAIHVMRFSHVVSDNRMVGGGCAQASVDTGLHFEDAFAFCSGNTIAKFRTAVGDNHGTQGNCQVPDPDDNLVL